MTKHILYNLLNIFARFLNFALFWIIVNMLGASAETDWFFFVYGFVYFCIGIAFYGLECSLVPIWPRLSQKEKNGFLQTCIILGIVGAIPLQLFGLAVSLYFPGFFGFSIPFSIGHTVLLSVVLFLQPPLVYFSALYSSLLQSSGKYFWPITHLSLRTLGVLPILLLPFCSGVSCVSIAYIVGELLRFLLLKAAARSHGVGLSYRQRFEVSPYKQYFVAMGWMVLMLSAAAVNPYVDLIMVGRLGDGSATLVEYAGRLRGIPVLLLSGTLIVFLGEWSRRQGQEPLWDQIIGNAWKMGLCGIMLSGGLILSKQYWIPLIFRVQHFDALQLASLDSLMTWYLVGAPFLLLTGTLGRGFMALQRFRLLATVAVLSVFVNIFLNLVFIDFFGIKGVAVSTTALDALLSCAYFFIGKRLSKTRKEI